MISSENAKQLVERLTEKFTHGELTPLESQWLKDGQAFYEQYQIEQQKESGRQFKTALELGYGVNSWGLIDWAVSHETDLEIAVAIHAISEPKLDRTAEDIWEAPTDTEYQSVLEAVKEYYEYGDFHAQDALQWGLHTVSAVNDKLAQELIEKEN